MRPGRDYDLSDGHQGVLSIELPNRLWFVLARYLFFAQHHQFHYTTILDGENEWEMRGSVMVIL